MMLTMVKEAKQPSHKELRYVSEHRDIIREILDHVGDELTLQVTWHLRDAPAGLHELRQRIDRISQRKLTLSLRHLIKNGLAMRKHTETFPSRAEYSLTPLGMMFLEQVTELMRWVDDHTSEIQSARSRFAKRSYKWMSLSEAQQL
jgi:DNA-binding HxlR family transcriptional regulator